MSLMIEPEYFSIDEYRCKCRKCKLKLDTDLLEIDNLLREQLKVPILITSGYRCISHNAAIKGSQNSKHLLGQASDKWVPKPFYIPLLQLMLKHKLGGIGIYWYPNNPRVSFLHGDVRPQGEARWAHWNGDKIDFDVALNRLGIGV